MNATTGTINANNNPNPNTNTINTVLNDRSATALARNHLRMGRVREAEALLEAWLQQDPNNASARVLQGWLLLTSGKFEEGRQLLETAVLISPHNAFAYVALGVLHQAQGKREEAELCWERALALDAADVDAAALLVEMRMQAGNVAAAEQLARAALAAVPDSPLAHFSLAEVLLGKGDVDESLDLCARGVAKEPDDWRGLLTYGRILMQVGKLSDARAKLEQALAMRPGEPELISVLALVFLRQEAWADAERSARKLLILNPRQTMGTRILLQALAGQGRFDDATNQVAQTVTATPPEKIVLQMDLAGMYRRAGRIEDAEKIALQAQTDADESNKLIPTYFLAELDLIKGNWAPAFETLASLSRKNDGGRLQTGLPAAEELRGRQVILTGDSFSQMMLFARYAARIAEQGAQVTLVGANLGRCGELAHGLQGVTAIHQPEPNATLEEKNKIWPEDALSEAMLCLPAHFGITTESQLWEGPYLSVPAERVAQMRAALAQHPRPWVGIELGAQPDQVVLQAVADAVRASGGTLVGLGPGLEDVLGETAVWPRIPDLHVLATWVEALDTVIAGSHLMPAIAGPLGKSAHILLEKESDALWGLTGKTSPWYPSLQLHRQTQQGGWQDAWSALRMALTELATELKSAPVLVRA